MSIWNIFALIGGLAIFLHGMIMMNKNLTSIAGEKMKSVMLTLTKGKVRGYLTGLGITMVNQSSSATTVLEAALVGAGLLTFQQSLAVTLGAELGSTFLPQLVAFPSITKFSTIIIAIGFFASISTKTKKGKHTAMTILGFGLLFMGMDMMSGSLKPLRSYQPFLNLMMKVEAPILGIIVGVLFTMIIQSSGATTGLTIAMAMAGTISLEQAVPINLGAAVGTCITAVLGSLALNWEAKRSAYIHIMFQLIGVIWIFILLSIPYHGERLYIYLVKLFCLKVLGTDSLAREIAMAFTFMPAINHIIVFPTLKWIVMAFNKMCPPREADKPFGAKYVNDSLIDESVDISLEMAKKEILRVAEIITGMFDGVRKAFDSKEEKFVYELCQEDSKVDLLHRTIIPFLAKISQKELEKKESERSINYLYIENELESIGDVIDKNIMPLAGKMIEQNLTFSEEGLKELDHFHKKIMKNLNLLLEALKGEDPVIAKKIKEKYSDLDSESYKELHIERLHLGLKESLQTSSVHLDLLNYLNMINGHILYIAERIMWLDSSIKKAG